MPSRFRLWCPLALATVGFASAGTLAQKGPALPDVLGAAANYLINYSQQLSAIEGEEDYLQLDTSATQLSATRRLKSDFILVGLNDGAVSGFRDVFELDGSVVRERQDRLMALFRTPPTTAALEQARALSMESVRHYISPNLATLDEPTLPLEFLRQKNQERSVFKLDSVKNMGGTPVAILKFDERATPRVIPTPGDTPVSGRFTVEVATGAVRRTELMLSGKDFNLRSTVNYAADPKLGVWLPIDLYLQVDVSGGGSGGISNMGAGGGYSSRQSLEARAKYGKFRRVSVDSTGIK